MRAEPIIRSLLDSDLYKYTMSQVFFHHFSGVQSEYKFICRNRDVDLSGFQESIEEQIGHLCKLQLYGEELEYLESLGYFKKDYLNWLENLRLKRDSVDIHHYNIGDGTKRLSIRIRGPIANRTFFEVPVLAIISELYCKAQTTSIEASRIGVERLEEKIKLLQDHPIQFADFGTRRRFSARWHEHVVKQMAEKLPRTTFYGTSNLYLAKKYKLTPIGTMAHEFIQLGQGLKETSIQNSQRYMLEKWVEEYRGKLGIALTDTIGMDVFLRDFDLLLAKIYDGARWDSSDPYIWGDKLIAHYEKLGIDPRTKVGSFTDNLKISLKPAINPFAIQDRFKDQLQVKFGIGTNVTNDCGIDPLSIVMKLVRVNGNPVAKISDEPEKAVCEDAQFLSYLKRVNGLKENVND